MSEYLLSVYRDQAPGDLTGKVAVSDAHPLPVTNANGFGAVYTDKAAFTEGTSLAAAVAGVYNETISADPTEDQAAALRITAKRGLHVNLRNASGTELGTSTTPVRVDPTGTTGQPATALVSSKAVAVTTSGAYAAGDVVGGILALATVNSASGRRVVLRSAQLTDKHGNALALRLYFFKATPAAGTYTDNAALVWGTGDAANQVGQLDVPANDWLSDAGQSSVSYGGLGLKMAVTATTLFALLVCPTGSAPTFTNGDLTLALEFDQE